MDVTDPLYQRAPIFAPDWGTIKGCFIGGDESG